MLINEIKSADWQPKLNKIGEIVEGIDDINQCLTIILTTPKGSVPHRPEFGSDILKYVDNPVNEAIPNIIRETADAISIWEKRIEIKSAKAEIIESNIAITLEWQLKNSDIASSLEVQL